jgi:hypothetical protein
MYNGPGLKTDVGFWSDTYCPLPRTGNSHTFNRPLDPSGCFPTKQNYERMTMSRGMERQLMQINERTNARHLGRVQVVNPVGWISSGKGRTWTHADLLNVCIDQLLRTICRQQSKALTDMSSRRLMGGPKVSIARPITGGLLIR